MSITYRDAGVNVDAGKALVDRIKATLTQRPSPELLGGLGGFAALARVPEGFKSPVLAMGTDGVGTKLDLLIEHDRLNTVGFDLVGMCVNDVLVHGAKPHLFLDYFATSTLDVDQTAVIVSSIANACEAAGCSLVGGETAEMPGFYPPGKFDLAGFCIGWLEESDILGPHRVQLGDVVVGLESSGPHSNGYSLIRKIVSDQKQVPSDILEALLQPTVLYTAAVLPHLGSIHALAHITGGGLKENVPRSIQGDQEVHVTLRAWQRPPVFDWLAESGPITQEEMLSTFNCGIGMVAFVESHEAESLVASLSKLGAPAHIIGVVKTCGEPAPVAELVIGHNRFEFGAD